MTLTSIKKNFLAFLTVLIAVSGVNVSQAADTSGLKETYIVRFTDDDDAQRESDDFKKKGMKVERTLSRAFKGVVGEFSASELNEIKKNPKVLYIEKDGVVQTTAFSSTPVTVNPAPSWGLDRVNQRNLPLDNAYSYQYDGQGVKAYVIDTGINSRHAQFAGRILPGNSQIADGRGTEDCNGHGTHVAGTIGARANNGTGVVGVNWDVKIISTKFLAANGGTISNAIRALDYITDLKRRGVANIVATNNSWGGGGFSQALLDAINRGGDQNILFIAAAGNSGADNNTVASYPSNYVCNNAGARNWDCVIAVAAINSTGAKSSFSSFGSTTVDIGAPAHRRRLRETEGPRSQTSAAARALSREFEPTGRSFRDSLGFLRKIGQQIQERSSGQRQGSTSGSSNSYSTGKKTPGEPGHAGAQGHTDHTDEPHNHPKSWGP